MTRWEYKTIKLATTGLVGGKLDTGAFDEHLNRLGHEGWELVAAFDTNLVYGQSRDAVAIFKRSLGR